MGLNHPTPDKSKCVQGAARGGAGRFARDRPGTAVDEMMHGLADDPIDQYQPFGMHVHDVRITAKGELLQPADRHADQLAIDEKAEQHKFTEHLGRGRQPIKGRRVEPGREIVGDNLRYLFDCRAELAAPHLGGR